MFCNMEMRILAYLPLSGKTLYFPDTFLIVQITLCKRVLQFAVGVINNVTDTTRNEQVNCELLKVLSLKLFKEFPYFVFIFSMFYTFTCFTYF